MSEGGLHVVFGTGQVGLALADRLAANATDLDAASDAAKGASVIYQCLNAPYTQWPELFPPLQRGVLTAAERAGALLVTLENIYAYGPAGGKPMTEDLLVAGQLGHRVGVRNLPPLVVRALGLVSPLMRSLAEMAYEFEEPFVLDTTKFESAFGTATTPLATAITDTVAWYRTQA